MIAIPSMAKIMVLDDATDLRALLSAEAPPTEHKKVVNNIMSHKLNPDDALGLVDGTGKLWSVVCQNTPHGDIPGRVDSNGIASYTWGGKAYQWRNVSEAITGSLYSYLQSLPSGCTTKRSKKDGSKYYPLSSLRNMENMSGRQARIEQRPGTSGKTGKSP